MRPGRRVSIAAACLLAGVLAGCATPPPPSHPEARAEFYQTNDPLEPTNRVLYKVNNGLDEAVLRPAAVAYKDAVPSPVRTGVHNVLGNLTTPVTLANNMLEGKSRRAGNTFMRFVINTTLGGLGLVDVASKLGYPPNSADFGETMAIWGVPEGPYLFLPLLGPSDPRDALGTGVDMTGDPFGWVGQGTAVTVLRWSRFGLTALDERSRVLGEISGIKRTALDPYATFRSLYRQHRKAQIEKIRADHRHTIPAWFPAPTTTH
ncbi:MAG: VacJ family lipoprotein [Rhodospirillales bacterium]|nr:VacJ family lipoprotein [Rhodospirillales bacterium]